MGNFFIFFVIVDHLELLLVILNFNVNILRRILACRIVALTCHFITIALAKKLTLASDSFQCLINHFI